MQLIPGADVKAFLGEGDDVIQTHAESGRSVRLDPRLSKLYVPALRPPC